MHYAPTELSAAQHAVSITLHVPSEMSVIFLILLLFYMFCSRNTSLCGRDLDGALAAPASAGHYLRHLLSHYPQKTISKAPRKVFEFLFLYIRQYG